MTAFFLPGLSADGRVAEETYAGMRSQIELETGRRPSQRRILQLFSRRGSIDCITEVGREDPLRGGTVIAIFDMGPHQPFVVWRQPDDGAQDGVREILESSAYSVLEFDRVGN